MKVSVHKALRVLEASFDCVMVTFIRTFGFSSYSFFRKAFKKESLSLLEM